MVNTACVLAASPTMLKFYRQPFQQTAVTLTDIHIAMPAPPGAHSDPPAGVICINGSMRTRVLTQERCSSIPTCYRGRASISRSDVLPWRPRPSISARV